VFSTSQCLQAFGEFLVFRTALVFLVLAIIAAVLRGSGSIGSAIVALLFYLFLAGFAGALLLGLITGRKTAS